VTNKWRETRQYHFTVFLSDSDTYYSSKIEKHLSSSIVANNQKNEFQRLYASGFDINRLVGIISGADLF
jgi:hypothetical protein